MDTSEDPTVRGATACARDGMAFARLLDQAQEGWYRLALGTASEAMVCAAFLERNHELSHEFVTIVERGGRPVAMSAAYSGRAHAGFASMPLRDAARGRLRYRLMTIISAPMLSFIDVVPADDFYVRALAVDPDQRGSGIGSMLLDVLAQSARSAGCSRLVLDVAATNLRARRLYERKGMVVEAESPRFLGLPKTNVFRMSRSL